MNKSVGWFFGIGVLGLAAIVLLIVLVPRLFGPKSRIPASYDEPFISAAKTNMSAAEIEKRSGIPNAVRARAVFIATGVLLRPHGKELKLRFELFPDVSPIVVLKVPSGFRVNDGMQSGFAPDDPESRVEITMTGAMLSGFVTYHSRKYRIVADPEMQVHYVVEEK